MNRNQLRTYLALAGAVGSAFIWCGAIFAVPINSGLTHTTGALSQARERPGATAVGDTVFFGGGALAGGAFSNRVDVYHVATSSWTMDQLPTPMHYTFATTVGSRAIFTDGSSTNVFDTHNNQWNILSAPHSRHLPAVAAMGDRLFIAGGNESAVPNPNYADIYDFSTASWTSTLLSSNRYASAGAAVGTKILFAGGFLGGIPSSRVDIFDTQTGIWSTAELSQPRWGIGATVVGDKAIFAGGVVSNFSIASKAVDIYDAASGQWSTTSLSVARGWLAAAPLGDRAIFAGGWDTQNARAEVDVYDFVTGGWSTDMLSQPRWYLDGATANGRAVFGGGHSSAASNVVDIFFVPEPNSLILLAVASTVGLCRNRKSVPTLHTS
jgi:hypothetical protein